MIVPSAPSGFGRAVRSPRPLLLVMWELPQNLLGAGLFAVSLLRGDIVSLARDRRRLFIHSRMSSVSLGWFVYFQTEDNRWFAMNDDTRAHEYGHSIQSRWLGPLYLPLVGIPSVSRVTYSILYRELTGRRWEGYFDGWPEKQADRLGGVVRARG